MLRKPIIKSAAAVILVALFLVMAGCGPDPYYVRVEFIEGVPDTGTAGTPLTLTATVRPSFASNNNIVWSVEDPGTTGASISRNILNANAGGTVKIRALIANGFAEGKEYTQFFLINIDGGAAVITPITNVALNVTGPAKNCVPDTTATPSAASVHYTISAVSWSPDHNPFMGKTVYTATLTLTADENYTFTGLAAATINGESAIIGNNTEATVTISYTFAETLDKEITGILIMTQPEKLNYIQGETLDLFGLVVTLSFDDGSTEDVADSDFSDYNITTDPSHGTVITLEHDEQPIVVSAGGHSADTEKLTVTQASGGLVTITFAQITDAAPNITGPTLSRSDTVYPKKETLTIEGSYDSITWEITGTSITGTGITGTGASFTLDAADARYNQDGNHHLTLIVYKDSLPYNKTIIFTIVP